MSKKKSMDECIETGDFEEAFSRWQNTSNAWVKKWFNVCVEIFHQSKRWAREYIIDPINQTITKIVNCVSSSFEGNYFYLMRAFDDRGLLFSKIGTTTRTVEQRMREHYKSYAKLGVISIICDKVYDSRDIPPECFESYFRAKYIKQYPNTFVKNDRFMGVTFDLQQADEIFEACKNL